MSNLRQAWRAMIARCHNSAHQSHHLYGGRGISVCDSWRGSFERFFADMGERPTPKHSLDRIDNDGNYEPGNCRWATPEEQQNNTRWNRWIVVDGIAMTIAQASRACSIRHDTLKHRLARGWSPDKATSIDPRAYQSRSHCKRGHEFTLANTAIDGRGARICRACKRITQREIRERSAHGIRA